MRLAWICSHPVVTRQINRPVFIFYGDSCACKSFIASKTGMKVFEVDAVDKLPEFIYDEIVVLGGRHKHITIEDVKGRVFNRESVQIVVVGFERCLD